MPIFHYLIKDKWDKFARNHYLVWALIPYAVFVVAATLAIHVSRHCVLDLRAAVRCWGSFVLSARVLQRDVEERSVGDD